MNGSVLVTGASGFLGSYLLNALLEEGEHVVVVDRSLNFNDVRCITIKCNLAELYRVPELPPYRFHTCYHFAGSSSVASSWHDPVLDIESNISTTVSIISFLAKFHPGCKLVIASSAAVYGNPSSFPIVEDAALEPISPYGIHKLSVEVLCEKYSALYNQSISILRIFSAYGPGLRKQLLWDTVCKLVIASSTNQNSISLSGTGMESRDFVYVSDVVLAALCVGKATLDSNFNVFNVASGHETSIYSIVSALCMIWKPDVFPVFDGNFRQGDPNRWVADISHISSLGYSPKTDFVIGLNDYVAWARDQFPL